MIKSELVDRISIQNPHLYRHDAEKIVNAIFSEIAAAMARGDRVELRGFGVFFVRVRAGFQLPTISAPTVAPSAMSVRRDSPRHMTELPGGGSLARAR
ncbi:MAG: HU family DNA-binding protein [Pseudolabrys sp.]